MDRLDYFRSKGANTNLDAERKRTSHFQSSWQQHVNVFTQWNRPECVQELYQEAQLNLQTLLQEFEEQLCDHKVTGQTFRQSPNSAETLQSSSLAVPHNKKQELVLLPSCNRACNETTSLENSSEDLVSTNPNQRQVLSSPSQRPPVPDKPRWQQRRPVNVTGQSLIPERSLALDLIQGTGSLGSFHSRVPKQPTEHSSGNKLVKKIHRNLEQSLPESSVDFLGMMEQASFISATTSWNGPKGSTFSPSWNKPFNSFPMPTSPVAKFPLSQHNPVKQLCPNNGTVDLSTRSDLHSSSSNSEEMATRADHFTPTKSVLNCMETMGSSVEKEKRSAKIEAFKFRGRSLSTPTDTESFCSVGNGLCTLPQQDGENYALLYPSGSSEDGASMDNMSGSSVDLPSDGRPRMRSRSISLKKPKNKPLPPVRSVSIRNNLNGSYAEETLRDGRPRSLHIPRDHLQDSFHSDFNIYSKPLQEHKSLFLAGGGNDSLVWCKSTDSSGSLSSSSGSKGNAGGDDTNVRTSFESLGSPSNSNASNLSHFSVKTESKTSPLKPIALKSPSSGYSSQSDTSILTVSTFSIMGPSPSGCKMCPKIPERKSSLPVASPSELSTGSNLCFEMPVKSHFNLSSLKPKSKASRRHSDSSTNSMLGQKLSPSQSVLPLVTQNDLRKVRLRSVSRSDAEDSLESSSTIEEEPPPNCRPPTAPKPKLPIAMKPPLPKRPSNLGSKSSISAIECSPSSPLEDIYKVVRKPKAKKTFHSPLEQSQTLPQPSADNHQRTVHHDQSISRSTGALDKSKTLPSQVAISSLAERDRKLSKVPPPIPKKPSVLFLPTNSFQAKPASEGQVSLPESDAMRALPEMENHKSDRDSKKKESFSKNSEVYSQDDSSEGRSSEHDELERSSGGATEEDSDDVFINNSATQNTEDLFTIIHRSKRKVLGRKEQTDSFGSKSSLVSPVKGSGDSCALTLGSTPRSSSRNDNFKALLQRKNSKPNTGARVSAMELLKSTNPLARRVTEFTLSEPKTKADPK